MTNAIRSTIITAVADHEGVSEDGLEYQYGGVINTAEQALLEREWAIAEELKTVALNETGFDEGDIDQLFKQVGLSVRPQPEPEPVVEELPAGERTDGERIAALEEGQAKIADALDRLTRLAEQHLGSSAL